MTWVDGTDSQDEAIRTAQRTANPEEAFRLLTLAHYRAMATAKPEQYDSLEWKYRSSPEYVAHYANRKPGERAVKLRQVCDAAEALDKANANLKAVWGPDFKPLQLRGTKPKE